MSKANLSLALCALIALAACDGRSKKGTFQKGNRKGQAASEWSKGVISTDPQGCLELKNLSKRLSDANTELLSIHLSDADFVTLKQDKIEIKQVERKPEASSRKTPATTVINTTTTTRNRLTFPKIEPKIESEFDQAKLKYFFGSTKTLPYLALTTPANKLKENTDNALLLNVKDQNGCQTVTFVTAQGDRLANVIDQSPNSIKIQLGEEIRTYTLLPKDKVMVTIVGPATDLDRCGANVPEDARVLRSYIVAKSRNMERFHVSTSLAQLLRYIYDDPELSQKPTVATPKLDAKSQAAPANDKPRRTSGAMVALSGSTLKYLADQYANKNQKVRTEEFTCSRAVIPRNN